MALQADGFDRSVLLPPELKITHIREAIEHIESRADELIDIYFEQANVFSGIIGILGTQALDALSPYKKHKHPDVAQQRFPDLSLRGKLDPPRSTRWNPKGRRARGLCNRTTITPAGTLFGAMRSTKPSG
jgi:hypothetical protein